MFALRGQLALHRAAHGVQRTRPSAFLPAAPGRAGSKLHSNVPRRSAARSRTDVMCIAKVGTNDWAPIWSSGVASAV